MSDKLKPCPFCGQVPEQNDGEIVCGGCVDEVCYLTTEAWNTRPIEDELRAEIARLKTALGVFDEQGAEIDRYKADVSRLESIMHESAVRVGELLNDYQKVCVERTNLRKLLGQTVMAAQAERERAERARKALSIIWSEASKKAYTKISMRYVITEICKQTLSATEPPQAEDVATDED